MELFKLTKTRSPKALNNVDQLALYDRYSSMAYGIILRIIPEPELAQTVLIDLFTSPQLLAHPETLTPGDVIRLARIKALAARSLPISPVLASGPLQATDSTINTAKLVFNLAFCQGYTPQTIAEKLHVSKTNVLKAFYTYFRHLRSS